MLRRYEQSQMYWVSDDGSEITPEWTFRFCHCSKSLCWSSTRGFKISLAVSRVNEAANIQLVATSVVGGRA